jgi:hypothetical protein
VIKLFGGENKKGQMFFFTLMLMIVVIILAIALAPAIKQNVDNIRNKTLASVDSSSSELGSGLDCANTSISDFTRGTCIITDLTLPTWIGVLLGLAGAILGARLIFQ